MADLQDYDFIPRDAISKNVWRNEGHFTQTIGRQPTAFAELAEALTNLDEPLRNAACGNRIERFDISSDCVQMVGGFGRPDYAAQISRRALAWASGFPFPTISTSG